MVGAEVLPGDHGPSCRELALPLRRCIVIWGNRRGDGVISLCPHRHWHYELELCPLEKDRTEPESPLASVRGREEVFAINVPSSFNHVCFLARAILSSMLGF